MEKAGDVPLPRYIYLSFFVLFTNTNAKFKVKAYYFKHVLGEIMHYGFKMSAKPKYISSQSDMV